MLSTALKGTIGMTAAMHYFTLQGYIVSIPLVDSQPYDLIVDNGERLLKVQVKSTTRETKDGKKHVVKLDTCKSNGVGGFVRKHFDTSKVDYVFVYTHNDSCCYLIPCDSIKVTTDLRFLKDSVWKV